jgi:PLP dependent protein
VVTLSISNNILMIKNNMEKAKLQSGRSAEEVMLVAVSKTQTVESIIQARDCGLTVFGENKVQELIEKYPLVNDVEWHLIGHLQKNKVKYIINKVRMIHSLDSVSLAEEINKRAEKVGRVMPVLIQINIGKEETKSGIFAEDVDQFVRDVSDFKNILINGIMTIPPITEDKEETREYFRRMREIFSALNGYKQNNMDIKYLSMGMTHDFELAIEEGANIVRVGTGIFGERNYSV